MLYSTQFPLIEQWSVIFHPRNGQLVLMGQIKGHPFQDDGDGWTSELLELNVDDRTARTRSRFYCLGEPDADYVKWCESKGKTLSGYFAKPDEHEALAG